VGKIIELLPVQYINFLSGLSLTFYRLAKRNRRLNERIVLYKYGVENVKDIFLWGVIEGKLELLKELHSKLRLSGKRVRRYYAVQYVAKYGRLEVLQWLYLAFNLTVEDLRIKDDFAFKAAAIYGNLEVLKWLSLKIGRFEKKEVMDEVFKLVIKAGRCDKTTNMSIPHLKVLRWLYLRYRLPRKSISDNLFKRIILSNYMVKK
jgi:hypothetical protein